LNCRFSTPDEVFGPVSISKLKEDKYVRIVKDYLPAAEVVFLDEIWKASPSIQNALLTIINEKVFRNGGEEIKVPMKALISASNELPAKDQGLEALWDRFLVRLVVGGIEDNGKFEKLISENVNASEDNVGENDKVTAEEYKKRSEEIDGISVPENVLNVIHKIRNYIGEYNEKQEDSNDKIYVSDRRWRKIVRLLRTSAFLNDRTEVDLMDCFLIQHCIWNEDAQQDAVYSFVKNAVEKYGYTVDFDFKGIKDEMDEFKKEIEEETKFIKDTSKKVLNPVYGDYFQIDNPPSQYDSLIKQSDFDTLNNYSQPMYLYYQDNSYGRVRQNHSYNIRKGDSASSIFINDTEYDIVTTKEGEERQITRKPNPVLEKHWNKKVTIFLKYVNSGKEKIEQYRNKDLKHLRTNLFVNPELANIVESHIAETLKRLDMLEVDIKKIQNDYKNLKDEEVVL